MAAGSATVAVVIPLRLTQADPLPEREGPRPVTALVRRSTPATRWANLRPWVKGQSGNPRGRPPALTSIRDLARTYTREAIAALVQVMRQAKSEMARVQACCAILDRAWGRPTVAVEHREPEGVRFGYFGDPAKLTDAQITRILSTMRQLRAEIEAEQGGPPA
jgi:hypothetical protein